MSSPSPPLTGNVHIRMVNPNVLTILEIMNRDVPVYAGIDRPLIHEWEDAAEFHGGDGLGNFNDRPVLTRRKSKTNTLCSPCSAFPANTTANSPSSP